MTDYAVLRQRMVDNQIRTRDVTDPGVIEAFSEIPREEFVGSADRPFAYADRTLSVDAGEGAARAMPAPALTARLVQALEIAPSDVVLAIGCASGYETAILAKLAGAVVAVEESEAMVERIEARLAEAGIDNVAVVTGPLAAGYPSEGPYDAILIAGGVEFVPDEIAAQLNDGGRLIAIERNGPIGRAVLHRRSGGVVSSRPVFDATAPVLPGFARKPAFVF